MSTAVANLNSYLNYFFQFLFGRPLFMNLGDVQTWLLNVHSSAIATDSPLSYWLSSLMSDPKYLISIIIHCLLLWFTIHLLLIYPFKWFRSLVKRK